jgi:type VI secretion system protein ImpH
MKAIAHRARRTLLEQLLEEPRRFRFDAAIAVLMRATNRSDPGTAVRFHAVAGLGFVPADILSVAREGNDYTVTTGLIGLTGPAGELPRPYTETVITEQRRRSPALARFLDMLAQRPIAQFAAAGMKYRPHRAADAAAIQATAGHPGVRDGLRESLLALTGYTFPGDAARLLVGLDPVLFYAGIFAARPRSADRLAALLSDWLGQTVVVEQFAGSWISLSPEQMSALPKGDGAGQFSQLGIDAAIGARAWDIQSRIVLRIGPLSLSEFQSLLPGRRLLARLVSLVQAYLEGETGAVINPVLAADAVPPLELQAITPPNLGWDSWLPTSDRRRHDAVDAVFDVRDIGASGAIA